MDYAVDIKQMGGDYVPKEIAIIPLNGSGDPLVRLFKRPFAWSKLSEKLKRENTWLEHKHHGISWGADGLNYSFIATLLREVLHDASRIFVLGELKQKWLQRFKFTVHNIEQYNYPSKPSFKCATVCTNHNPTYKTT